MKSLWRLARQSEMSDGYWAAYSDLMAGILLVFAVAGAAAWIQLETTVGGTIDPVDEWEDATKALCEDPALAQPTVRVDCATGTLMVTEESLRYETNGVELEILSKVVDGVSSGGFLSDAIDEGHAIDDLDDQLSPVQCSPLFLRGQRQLEDHR